MQLQEALRLIREFWQEPVWPFQPAPTAEAELARLRQEFAVPLLPELEEYLTQAAPLAEVSIGAVGNPIDVYGLAQMGLLQDGDNFNSLTHERFDDWPAQWFMVANEGGDPIIIDLAAGSGAVIQLEHGAGDWEGGIEMAASIGQFLLCAAAREHALRHLTPDRAIRDDENGFCLVPVAAAWLFPRMRAWAGPYYRAWCSVFDNA